MAIPIIFLTAIVEKSAIEASYPGGLDRFLREQPGASRDECLLGVSFMSGGELDQFVGALRASGFDVDSGLAIGELLHGEWKPCNGIEFARAATDGLFARWEARLAGSEAATPETGL